MMKATRFAGRLRMTLRKFCTGQGGNIIIPFALLLVPIMGAVGAAVDYSRASSDRASMQAAVDAAALILSKNVATLGASQIGPAATNYFKANFNRTDVLNVAVTPVYSTSGGSQIVVTATGTVPTTFLKVLGFSTVDITASSTVKWGNSRLRVALVLDNTGSMSSSNKMTALKNATNSLLAQLKSAAVNNGDVYVSIIPFAKDVAVDVTNYTQPWIDWTDWEAEPANLDTARGGSKPSNWSSIGPGDSCPFTDSSHGFRCTTGPATGASTTSSIPSGGNYDGYICPSMDSGRKNTTNANVYYNGCYNSSTYSCTGSSCTCTGHSNCSCSGGTGSGRTCKQPNGYYEHTWRPSGTPAATAHSTWNGCITDRGDSTAPSSGNYDTNVAAPNINIRASLFPAEQYASCPRSVMALNYNWATMTTLVNNMSPDGNTNQAIGLAWGWLSLVGGGPFTNIPAMDSNYTYQQVIILLTDGLNTENRWYTNQTSIDARQQITCNNINAAGITLYAVQVNTGSDPTSALLKNCAGTASPRKYPDPDKFFLLTSADQIVTTFAQIGTELSNLRVAK
jgi:Flp pilus assembly protein TadG